MNTAKYILRGILLLSIVSILIYLDGKTDDNFKRIAKFKLETLNKIKADSLDTKVKLDVLIKETTKFNEKVSDDSPSFKKGRRYLILVIALLVVAECAFYVAKARRVGD